MWPAIPPLLGHFHGFNRGWEGRLFWGWILAPRLQDAAGGAPIPSSTGEPLSCSGLTACSALGSMSLGERLRGKEAEAGSWGVQGTGFLAMLGQEASLLAAPCPSRSVGWAVGHGTVGRGC